MNVSRDVLLQVLRSSSKSPLDRVELASAMARAGDSLVDTLVEEARAAGVTWVELTDAMGVLDRPMHSGSGSADPSRGTGSAPVRPATSSHDGKYHDLWKHLRESRESRISLSFTDVERVLGFALPPSSRRHEAHWYGYEGSAVARAIVDAGWKAQQVDLAAERLTFVRTTC